MQLRVVPLAFAILVATAARSPADSSVDVELRGGDRITGTLRPATETESFRVRVPQGAAISVRAKPAKSGPALHVILRDPGGTLVDEGSGRGVRLGPTVASLSGVFSVEVASQDETSTGDYALQIAWASAKSAAVDVTLPAAGDGQVAFAADAGTKVSIGLKPRPGSAAQPVATRIDGPNGYALPLTAKGPKIVLPYSGDYHLQIHDGGAAGGAVGGTVRLKPPAPSRRKIALTDRVIGAPGDDTLAVAAVLGSEGGEVFVPPAGLGGPGGAIAGASVLLPPGALTTPTAIVVATAPDLPPPSGFEGTGPTVFFGPEGLRFRSDVTVTIPFAAAFAGDTSLLEIFTRDAHGRVTRVPGPYVFDILAHTVTYATTHFSSFRAAASAAAEPNDVATLASVADPRDVCVALDEGARAAGRVLYVAQGGQSVVGTIKSGRTGNSYEVFAGGGTSTADGTPRLDFKFPGAVQAVCSTADAVYVATGFQVYRIDAQDNVTLFAGGQVPGDSGDGLPATQAKFTFLVDVIASAAGDVFLADLGAHKIRKIDGKTGLASTYAGNGGSVTGSNDGEQPELTAFVGPHCLEFERDALYVGDAMRLRVIKATGSSVGFVNVTVAGSANLINGSTGDDGPPNAALFQRIRGIALEPDPANPKQPRLLVADDVDHTVRRIDFTLNVVTLVAGTHGQGGRDADPSSTPGHLDNPQSVASRPGAVIVCDGLSDPPNGRLRLVVVP